MNLSLKLNEQVKKDLDAIQGGCSVRVLRVEDVESVIQDNEDIIKELSKYDVDFYLEYQEGDFKKGYSYEGTGFIAKFNKNSSVKEINCMRSKNRGIYRIVVNLDKNTELEKKLLRKMFNISSANTITLG